MSKTPPSPDHQMPREHYLNATYGIRSWLLTTDHKRIALLCLRSGPFLLFLGRLFPTMVRIPVLTPTAPPVTPQTSTKLSPMHALPPPSSSLSPPTPPSSSH